MRLTDCFYAALPLLEIAFLSIDRLRWLRGWLTGRRPSLPAKTPEPTGTEGGRRARWSRAEKGTAAFLRSRQP